MQNDPQNNLQNPPQSPEAEPPPDQSRRHPLDRAPQPRPRGQGQQVRLVIPSNRPLVTYAILAIIIGLFIIRALSPEVEAQTTLAGANNQTQVLGNGEYYRLFTSIFLHLGIYNALGQFDLRGILHIFFNAYLIYTAGMGLERLIGHVRYAIIFLLGGLSGSILTVLLDGPNTYSLGASGAVFAIIGAEFIFLYRHRRLLGESARVQMRSLILWAAFNFLFGALSTFSTTVRIANWAHLGGLLAGLLLAAFINPFYIPRTDPTRANTLIADDINPLRERLWLVSLYVAVLMVVLIVARQLAA